MRQFCVLKHAPYNLFKKSQKSGVFWYVRFWNETEGKFSVIRSTSIRVEGRRENRSEADKVAREMLPSIRFSSSYIDDDFLEYVEGFWTPESSYVKERSLLAKKPLSAYYIKMNRKDVNRHLRTFSGFKGKALKDISTGLLLDWQRWAIETHGMSARRVNAVMQSMRIAVRYAVKREDLDRDPFKRINDIPVTQKEKGVLTPLELKKLASVSVNDPRVRAAVFFGAYCGLRRGEIRGVRWGDIDEEFGVIHVRHNWIDGEGNKAPKCGSVRTVPLSSLVIDALESLKPIFSTFPMDFVIPSLGSKETPVSIAIIRGGLRDVLSSIGIPESEQKRRNITLHGLRHSFVTFARLAGIPDMEVQAMAGHKSGAMMERYSHASQVIDFADARAKLEAINEDKKTAL